MSISLGNLIEPQVTPLGYPVGWVGGISELLEGLAGWSNRPVRVDSAVMGEVLACEGLWENRRQLEGIPNPARILHQEFVQKRVLDFVDLHLQGGEASPLNFVHAALANEDSLDPLTAAWLLLMPEDKRKDLAEEIIAAISRLVESWPEVLDGSCVSRGPVAHEYGIGNVTLYSKFVDLVVGSHRVGTDALWPGAVLIRLVAGPVTQAFLDSVSVDSLIHTLVTGCPPARLVVFSLTTGFGCAMDVERDWMMGATGAVRAAAKAMASVHIGESMTLTPGHHCVICPNKNECPVSEADEYPF